MTDILITSGSPLTDLYSRKEKYRVLLQVRMSCKTLIIGKIVQTITIFSVVQIHEEKSIQTGRVARQKSTHVTMGRLSLSPLSITATVANHRHP